VLSVTEGLRSFGASCDRGSRAEPPWGNSAQISAILNPDHHYLLTATLTQLRANESVTWRLVRRLADRAGNHTIWHSLQRRLMALYITASCKGFLLWVPVEKLFMSEIGFDPASIGLMATTYADVLPSSKTAVRRAAAGDHSQASVSRLDHAPDPDNGSG
jgi:hypothetical protein